MFAIRENGRVDAIGYLPVAIDHRAVMPRVGVNDPPLPTGAVIYLDARTIAGADGDAIALWDNMGSGGDAVQASAVSKPALRKTDGPLGKPAVDFDGVQDFMVVQGTAATMACLITTKVFELYFAIQRDNIGDPGDFFANTLISSEHGLTVRLFGGPTYDLRVWLANGAALTLFNDLSVAVADNDWHALHYYADGTTHYASDDLTNYYSDPAGAVASGDLVRDIGIGAAHAAASPYYDNLYNGKIAMVLAYDRQLDAGERALVSTFFSEVWGL